MRFSSELADRLGCSRSHLFNLARDSGLYLSPLLRWGTLMRGLQLYDDRDAEWLSVALILGFTSNAAWANFVRRLTGSPPSELRERMKGDLLTTALRGILRDR